MVSNARILPVALLAGLIAGFGGEAAAQLISNKPFEFSRRGGGGIGMSLGHRQAILEQELFNRRPENLLRDATGALLEIERGPSNQAFVRRQASPFLPGASAGIGRSGGRFIVSGAGTGLSIGGVGIGFSTGGFGLGAGFGFGGGIGLEYGVAPSQGTLVSQASPIDGWISQLYNGHSGSS